MRIPGKRLGIGIMAAALALSMAGCSNTDKPAGDDGTKDAAPAGGATEINLLVPSYSDGTKALWEDIIKGFEAENSDIKVKLEVQSWDNINDVVRTKISGDQAPDILNIDSFTSYAADELLYEAADVVSPDTLSNFQDSFNKNASVDGVQMALPFIASARAFFYNTDLFEKAGVAEAPKTWADFKAAAEKIKALGEAGVSAYGMPLGSEEAQAETAIWFWGAGGDYTDGKKITIDTPANLEGATFMKELIDAGLTQADPGASQRTPLGETFFQGKVGMLIGLPQYIKFIADQNPDLKYAIAPIPTKDGSDMTLGVADHIMAFKNDETKQEAITKFLDYFFSDAVYVKHVQTEGFIPTTKSGGEALKDDPTIKDFIPLLPDAKFYPFTNTRWQDTQGAIQQNIGRIASEDPAGILKEIQAVADEE